LRAAADLLSLAPLRISGDTDGAVCSLVARLLWEHNAPIPNKTYITTINELQGMRCAKGARLWTHLWTQRHR